MKVFALFALLASSAFAAELPAPDKNDTCAGNPNRAIYLRELDLVVNQRKFEHIDELFAPDYRNNSAPPGAAQGPAAIREYLTLLTGAFPDRKVTNIGMICAGDFVIVRSRVTGTSTGPYFGQPPTGKSSSVEGTDIYLIKDGKFRARWGNEDALGMMQQLGYIAGGRPR